MYNLCNKPNCLHDKETDTNKVSECNAYSLFSVKTTEINYMNGAIYYITWEWNENDFCDVLYKI